MIKIRIFIGGRGGQSRIPFDSGVGHIQAVYKDKIAIDILDTDMMKNNPAYNFSPKEFIDWLLQADIHIIVGHMHQGLDKLCWDMEEQLQEYTRLRDHIGYTGGALDPVFLQDKIKYLQALDEDDYLPTLVIDMPTLSEDGEEIILRTADLEKIRM